MAKRILRLRRSILIALVIPAITYCSKPVHNSDGGQHSGGGFVAYSTLEDVNAAIDKAIALASEPEADKNIFAQFWFYWGRKSHADVIKTPTHIFPNIKSSAQPSDLTKDAKLFDSPPLRALKTNPWKRLKAGNCLESKAHNDASVSSFTTQAEICMSIGNLTRIPPSSLLKEVLSLILHEASHMGGADEAEAVQWQEEFSAYFGARFGDIETDSVTVDTLKDLEDAKLLVASVKDLAVQNPKNPKIFALMAELSDKLNALPYYSDLIALELKTNALKPELINNYSYSVLALMQKTKLRFVVKSDLINAKGMVFPIDFLPTDKTVSAIEETANDLDQIEENFLAFLGGSPRARSVCVKPDDSGNLNLFPIKPPHNFTPDTIERRCPMDL